MVWDTENTKQKIKGAALAEFTAHGPDGTTVERIAKRAKVNKERIYSYFGNKQELFKAILHEELDQVAEVVGLTSLATEDIGDYAGRMYDYHRDHPDLLRLLRWESPTRNTGATTTPSKRMRCAPGKRRALLQTI